MNNRNLSRGLLAIVWTALCVCLSAPGAATAQEPRRNNVGSRAMREPNRHAPEVYADKLRMKIALADLPGAGDPRSSWEGSYQLYFIPEAEYYRVIEQLGPGGHSLQPAQFANKVLLAEGRIKKSGVGTSQERTVVHDNINFKSKIADQSRTKFARLMTTYSVKIYDARLDLPLYRSGLFMTYPFDAEQGNGSGARATVYLNFSVTPQGKLTYSQWARP